MVLQLQMFFALVIDAAVAIVKSAAATLIDVAVVNDAAVANVTAGAAISFVVLFIMLQLQFSMLLLC